MNYLFFDFDKTLAYRDGRFVQTMLEVAGRAKVELDREEVQKYLKFPWHTPELSHAELFQGKPWWGYMEGQFYHTFKSVGLREDMAENLAKEVQDEYRRSTKWLLYEDTISVLERSVQAGYMNIVASNHVPELEEIVVGLGIRDYFVEVFTSGKLGYEKPNPNFFRAIAEGLKLQDDDKVVMIGDNYAADVQGALQYGFDAILVRSPDAKGYAQYSPTLDGIFAYLGSSI